MSQRMPVVFVGHGSPMNAVEDSAFSEGWKKIAADIPVPKAILMVSAHWMTEGSFVNDSASPKMVYDMYGFPEELYAVKYNASGSAELAHRVQSLLNGTSVDNTWGIDHGAWSVLRRMYPKADIPVVQLSVDMTKDAAYHFNLGKALAPLRDEGVLVIASGNVVHNLSRVDWNMDGGYDWASQFDSYITSAVKEHRFSDVIHYEKAGSCAQKSFTTPDHFFPLLYVLGASGGEDEVRVYNNECALGAISMTCFVIGKRI